MSRAGADAYGAEPELPGYLAVGVLLHHEAHTAELIYAQRHGAPAGSESVGGMPPGKPPAWSAAG